MDPKAAGTRRRHDAVNVSNLDILQVLAAAMLLGGSLPAVIMAAGRCLHLLRTRTDRPARALLVVALVVGALLRWVVVPHGIATVWIGYRWTGQAIDLFPVSHYGAGAQAFYHALFALLPWDHRALMAVNAVLGVLLLPVVAALTLRLFRSPLAGALAAFFVAVVPLFVRNDTSDANNVPVLFWLVCGLVLLDAWLEEGRASRAVGAAGLLTLAAVSRPETLALVPLFALLVAFATGRPLPSRRLAAGLASGAALLALPHVLHVLNQIRILEARHSLPALDGFSALTVALSLSKHNVFLQPALFPVGITLLAVAALVLAGRQRWRPAAACVAGWAVALLVYVVDLDGANVARVQVPAALMATVLAAAGLAWLLERRLSLGLAAASLCLLSAIPGAFTHWAPTNEAVEERIIHEVVDALPEDRPFTLVRISHADQHVPGAPRAFAHSHFPDYHLLPPIRSGRVIDVQTLLDGDAIDEETYFFWGWRCHARFRTAHTDPVPDALVLPACEAVRELFALEPVLQWRVPNHGDVWIRYYPKSPEVTLGLYRLAPRSEAAP
jgi:hypothetical protein